FRFHGQFAPGDGIDRLIKAWEHVTRCGRLLLCGPDCAYKTAMIDLARSLCLLDRTVFFKPTGNESDLAAAVGEADVGVILHEPITVSNRLAYPYELSRYLAAGLPVICDELEFVRGLVIENGIGRSWKFGDEQAVAALCNEVIATAGQSPVVGRGA